jgi:hypothetical protein
MVLYCLKITDLLPLEIYEKRNKIERKLRFLPFRAELGAIFQRVDGN